MHEGGSDAPTPSDVADRLAQQNLASENTEDSASFRARVAEEIVARERAKGNSGNDTVFRNHVADEIIQRELVRTEERAIKKAQKARKKKRTGADGIKGGPEGTPAGVDPASAVVVVAKPGTEASSKPQDVEEHVGEADGKVKPKRGKRKRGRGGQGAKVGPDRQQAAPVVIQRRPAPAQREQGGPRIPDPDTRPNLSLPREQRKAEVDKRLAGITRPRPTRWDKPPAQAPRRSPPRWDNRRSAPEPCSGQPKTPTYAFPR